MNYEELGKDLNLYNIYIGEIDFNNNSKKLLNVTSYIENNISLNKSRDGTPMSINNMSIFLPMKEDIGDLEVLKDNMYLVGMPFLIIKVATNSEDNEIIFNGMISESSYELIGGIDPEFIRYSITTRHKSEELSRYIFNKEINKFDITIEKFIKNILNADERTNKYDVIFDNIDSYVTNDKMEYLDINTSRIKDVSNLRLGDCINFKYGNTQEKRNTSIITEIKRFSNGTNVDLFNWDFEIINSDEEIKSSNIQVLITKNSDEYYSAVFYYYNESATNNYSQFGYISNGEFGVYEDVISTDNRILLSKFKIQDDEGLSSLNYIIFDYSDVVVNFINDKIDFSDYNSEPVNIYIGYTSLLDNEVVSNKVYDPATNLKYISEIFSNILDKYNKNYIINNNCEIIFNEEEISEDNTIILSSNTDSSFEINSYDNINYVVNSLSLNSEVGNIVNNLMISNYKNDRNEETTLKIEEAKPKPNLYFKTDYEISNSNVTFSKDEDVSGYITLGNNDSSYASIIFNSKCEESGFLQSISLNLRRNQLSENTLIISKLNDSFIQINTSSNSENKLDIIPSFLNVNEGDNIEIEIGLYEENNDMSISSFSRATSLPKITYNIEISDATNEIKNGSYVYLFLKEDKYYHFLKFISYDSVNDIFKYESIASNSYDNIGNTPNMYLATYDNIDNLIEFEYSNTSNGNDKIERRTASGIQFSSIFNKTAINSTFFIQQSYCFAYPTDSNGTIIYAQGNDLGTEMQEVGLVSYTSESLNDNFFKNTINEAYLAYVEFYNHVKNAWYKYRVLGFNNSTGVLSMGEYPILNSQFYYGNNKQVKMRRIFSTKTISISQKDANDNIYESYIVEDSGAYGFNLKTDYNAIEYLLNDGGEDYWSGLFLDKNSLIGVYYKTSDNNLKIYQNLESIKKYGYFDEIHNTLLTNAEDLGEYIENVQSKRRRIKLKGEISLKIDTFVDDSILFNAQYISIDSSFFNNYYETYNNEKIKFNNIILFKILNERHEINIKLKKSKPRIINFTIEEVI